MRNHNRDVRMVEGVRGGGEEGKKDGTTGDGYQHEAPVAVRFQWLASVYVGLRMEQEGLLCALEDQGGSCKGDTSERCRAEDSFLPIASCFVAHSFDLVHVKAASPCAAAHQREANAAQLHSIEEARLGHGTRARAAAVP